MLRADAWTDGRTDEMNPMQVEKEPNADYETAPRVSINATPFQLNNFS